MFWVSLSILDEIDFYFSTREGKIGIALSGGKDSVALLLLAIDKFGCDHVVGLHVDHQARALKSCEEESSYIVGLSNKLGVECLNFQLERTENHSEEVLRNLRYCALAKMANEKGLKTVALGHHKFDQSESFMLHLLRGSDINGLTGMRESFESDGIAFVRPLLKCHPKLLQDFLELKKIKPFEDPSNAENIYKRNRIRNELFILLEELQPGVSERLADFSDSLKEIDEWKKSCLAEMEKELTVRKNNNGELLYTKSFFNKYPKPVVKEWCYKILNHWAGGKNQISRRHVLALTEVIQSDKTGYWPEVFPGNVQIRVRKREIVVKLSKKTIFFN